FRHFSFSIVIVGTQARFIRWDASAVVVTAQFDYNENPEIMAKFFWQFSNLPANLRGHDESVCPAELQTDVEERVRSGLNLVSETPLFRYSVPGLKGYCYGPRPPYPSRSIIGRTTRTLPVWFVPPQPADEQHHAVYLKDCWRFISFGHDVQPEHEIYEMLNSKGIPNIPTSVCGGDVEGPGSKTDTHTLVDTPWLCVELKVTPFIHYRLVLDVVGRPLTSFRCTKELVGGVLDAMKAHWSAYEVLQLLHRDISPGNIILTEDGRGLLIDWELAKTVGEIGNRRRERTFMSAALLRKPGKLHMLEDDIESFLHVLGWATIKYVPTTDAYSGGERASDLHQLFDVIDFHLQGAAVGGKAKASELHGGGYPPATFELKSPSPLLGLLETLSSPFKSRYIKKPPTDEERALVVNGEDSPDTKTKRLFVKVSQYDEDMALLKSSTWFIETLEQALLKEGWPTDDKAEKGLVEHTSILHTRPQISRKSDQLLSSQSQWEDSKSVASAGSLKREGSTSPMPEGRTKRPRDAPLGSNARN
ncbi:hypothetical protein BU15DRAFT_55980, partial [Melanogaster broomeanus]